MPKKELSYQERYYKMLLEEKMLEKKEKKRKLEWNIKQTKEDDLRREAQLLQHAIKMLLEKENSFITKVKCFFLDSAKKELERLRKERVYKGERLESIHKEQYGQIKRVNR
jgi:hypothetical protein